MRKWGMPLAALLALATVMAVNAAEQVVPERYVPSDRDLRVTVLDVGQGDAVLVRTPSKKAWLIDSGGDTVSADGSVVDEGKRKVLPFLAAAGITELEGIIFSHSHPDHVGGLRAVLETLPVKAVYESGLPADVEDAEYYQCLAIIRSRGIPCRQLRAGERLQWGDGVTAEILGPQRRGAGKTNNASLVVRISYGTAAVLLPGDAELEEERWLVRRSGEALRADVMKVPHHGSYSSSSRGFLAAVRPKAAVVSCGLRNAFDHPHAAILARYRKSGIRLYRTDYDGDVTVTTNGGTFKVETGKGRRGR